MAKLVDEALQVRHYPYQDGSVIQVDYYPEEAGDQSEADNAARRAKKPISMSVKVVKTLSTTFSCVLLVDLLSYNRDTSRAWRIPKKKRLSGTSHMILKLCDRRFAKGLRDDYEASEWTPDIETDFLAFQALPRDQKPEINVSDDVEGDSWYDGHDSEGASTSKSGESDGDYKSAKEAFNQKWTPGHREAYLQKWCDKLYAQELEVYRTLADVQGEKVPVLYGTVRVRDKARRSRGIAPVQGLLMEYKSPSFPLRDIPERMPNQDLWHDIGKAAVKLVQDVGDLGVLNRDIRLENILVAPVYGRFVGSPNNSWELLPSPHELELELQDDARQFKVFMIDFGIARIQGEDETNDEFRRARKSQDEEGAIGYVLERYLMKHARGCKPFKFRHSRRLDRPWDDEDADI